MWRIVSLGLLGVSASLGVTSTNSWNHALKNDGITSTANQPIHLASSSPSFAQSPSPSTSPIQINPDGSPPTPLPTSGSAATGMLQLAGVDNSDVLYVLGSGDGQLAIAAAQTVNPRRVVVVENNPDLLKASQQSAQKAGFGDRIQFLQQDPLQTNLKEASVVAIQLTPESSQKLRSKLLAELKPGARIVSQAAQLGDWKPDKTADSFYSWVVPASVDGDWKGDLEYAPGRRYPYTLRFTQQFQNVKGDVVVDGKKYSVSNVGLVGDRLTFSRTDSFQGQTMTATFNGRVEGNTLKGTADLQAGIFSRKFPVLAKRNK